MERFGRVDILVNNAATNPYFGPMLDISGPQAQKTLEVNQLAVLTWTSAAHRAGALGAVVNMSSIGGIVVEPDLGWYNTTKAALLHMTRQLSIELGPNVRVNAIAPGLVKTQFAAALWEGRDEDRIADSIPLRRLGTVDDIADAVVFLSSDRASWIIGQTLVVDGGTLLARTRLSVT